MTSASGGILITAIGSGSCWAELAVARPLFAPLGHAYLPISGPPTFEPHLNITYYVECHLHSHYNVLTSTGIENGIVCWGSFDWLRPVNADIQNNFAREWIFHLRNRGWPLMSYWSDCLSCPPTFSMLPPLMITGSSLSLFWLWIHGISTSHILFDFPDICCINDAVSY